MGATVMRTRFVLSGVVVFAGYCLLEALPCMAAPPAQAEAKAAADKPAAAKPESTKPAATAAADIKLDDEQRKLAERYDKLEKAFGRLAELVAATDPKQAALLRQAFAESRSRLIDDHLNELVKQLAKDELFPASKGQVQVQQDLNDLLKLLQSGDSAKKNITERELIRNLIGRLDKMIKNVEGIHGLTEGDGDAKELAEQQRKEAEKAKILADDIRQLEPKSDTGDSKGKDGAKDGGKNGDKPDSKDGDKSGDKNGEKNGGKPGDKSGDKPGSKSGDKSGDKPGDKNGNKPGDKPGDKSGDKPADKSGDKPGDKSGDKPGDKSGGKPGDKSGAKPGDEPGDKSSSKPGDKPGDKSGDKNGAKPGDKSDGKNGGKPGDKPGKPNPGQGQGEGKDGDGDSDIQSSPKAAPPDDEASPARKRVQAAEDRMRKAQKHLEEANRKGAAGEQQEAVAELKEAKAQLEKILRQMREEEIQRVLAQLEARFRHMLLMQIEVYEGTVRLDKVPQADRGHEEEVEAGRLSRDETAIVIEADRALNLLHEEGSAVAFPESVDQMREDMQQVADRLASVKVELITQGVEQDIIAALQETIAALQKAQKPHKPNKPKPPGKAGPKEDPLVDQIAELKMIRALQMRVNTRTKRYSKLLEGDVEETDRPDLVEALKHLADREDRIHAVTHDIVVGKNH
jgi:hypothetical protein